MNFPKMLYKGGALSGDAANQRIVSNASQLEEAETDGFTEAVFGVKSVTDGVCTIAQPEAVKRGPGRPPKAE